MGIPRNAKYICLLVRDTAYYSNHSDNDTCNSLRAYRNADISSYKKAALFLAENDFYVIRMGKKINTEFDVKHKNVIDYASSQFRSDFMDIYLSATCYFFMSTLCGLDGVAHAFRRPILATNVTTNGYRFLGYPVKLFLAKTMIEKNTGNILTFKQQNQLFHFEKYSREVLGHDFFHNVMNKYELRLVDNSEDEILNATKEMLARMQGEKYDSDSLMLLQRRIWSEIFNADEHQNDIGKNRMVFEKYFPRYSRLALMDSSALLKNEFSNTPQNIGNYDM